jgi:GNAT superfamily N-acetyltransferase
MNITIKALGPALAQTFADYLGKLSFEHEPHWATCFCRYYHCTCSAEEWMARSGEMNRAEAIEAITRGDMRGYLAFEGEKCIGWCNANDTDRFIRLKEDLAPWANGRKTGCVICFVIHPDHRGKGIARRLLQRAVEDFKKQGYDAILALPVHRTEQLERRYRGTYNMYIEQGFEEAERDGATSVMLLRLRKIGKTNPENE